MTEEQHSSSSRGDQYSERLTVPVWWWLVAVAIAVVIAYEVQIAAYFRAWSVVAYPAFILLFAWLLFSMSRTSVRVDSDGALHAGKAMLPSDAIARGAVVAPAQRSAAMGRQLDPAAYVLHRSWVKSMVLVVLDDPDDPTPYWLISTRHPAAVLAALGLTDESQAQDAAQE
ncbi:DUF3093 domain-containing protein [Gordonia shandongensis]|uniref:DUF3093 domain-containing protein n=1 Tax=Gordonia shandongensis TaxID=376351 RepID=UPI00047999FD|nr:DUF3093 domain-containing protein [Gordonia shandongensis]